MSDTGTQVPQPDTPDTPVTPDTPDTPVPSVTPDTPATQKMPKGHTAKDIQEMATLYHVPLSDETIKAVADGGDQTKITAFENYLKTSAEGLYPTLAAQIKAGIPTAYLLDPYRQVAKSVLGDQFEPDFVGNPRDAQALQGGSDPKTGRPTPMSLSQWKQTVMTDPRFGYDQTPHAIAAAQYAMSQLHQSMQSAQPAPAPGDANG